MKAEQRKDLETNALADKMGQAMQRVKTGTRRTILFYFLGAIVLAAALFVGYRFYATRTDEAAEQWVKLHDGSPQSLRQLIQLEKDTKAGKAARFQYLWLKFWEAGVKRLATDQPGALITFEELESEYKELADECKDDPIFESQAKLGRAVSAESRRAVQDDSHLDRAKKMYEEILEKHADTAEGKYSKDRLDILKDAKKLAEVRHVYLELRFILNIPLPKRNFPQFDLEPRKDEGKKDAKDEPKKDESKKGNDR